MARQKLGQHFLVKGAILERIARASCAEGAPLVVEIGPGRGALTERLLARADRVIAIELDPYLVDHLRARFPERLTVLHADALTVDLAAFDAPVCGNLPYYAATPIMEKVVDAGRPGVFLIQKEVALRLAATPGSRDYGFLTVKTALQADAAYLFEVKPGAFHPPPKVDSAVVRLTPRDRAAEWNLDRAGLLRMLSAAFRHKRKTLRNNLSEIYPKERVDALPDAGERAEQIPLERFAAIYCTLCSET